MLHGQQFDRETVHYVTEGKRAGVSLIAACNGRSMGLYGVLTDAPVTCKRCLDRWPARLTLVKS